RAGDLLPIACALEMDTGYSRVLERGPWIALPHSRPDRPAEVDPGHGEIIVPRRAGGDLLEAVHEARGHVAGRHGRERQDGHPERPYERHDRVLVGLGREQLPERLLECLRIVEEQRPSDDGPECPAMTPAARARELERLVRGVERTLEIPGGEVGAPREDP